MTRFWLVGEAPNAATIQHPDLWLRPDDSGRKHTANRLRDLAGWTTAQYLRVFEHRDNVLERPPAGGRWRAEHSDLARGQAGPPPHACGREWRSLRLPRPTRGRRLRPGRRRATALVPPIHWHRVSRLGCLPTAHLGPLPVVERGGQPRARPGLPPLPPARPPLRFLPGETMNPRLRSLLLLPLATLVLLLSPLAVVIFPVAAGLLAGAYTFFAAFQRTAYSVICDVIRMPLDWWDIVRWIFTGVKHSERRAQAEYERAHEEMMEAVGRRGAQRRGAQQ